MLGWDNLDTALHLDAVANELTQHLAWPDDEANVEAWRARWRDKFKTLLPLYTLKAAAGYFGNGEEVEPEGWVEARDAGPLDEQMFVARAVGKSMEPTICDGALAVFRANPTGTRKGKIVLAQYRGSADPETGGAFTVKKYSSEKRPDDEGGWRHTKIVLSPLNPDYQPIVIPEKHAGDFAIVAEFVAVIGRQ